MAAATCQYEDTMNHFGTIGELRDMESRETSGTNGLFDEDLSRTLPQMQPLSHGPPNASHFSGTSVNPHSMRNMSAPQGGSGMDERLNDSERLVQKRDKDAIYAHPLFPLLALIFEKCELATCTPRDAAMSSGDVCSSDSFNDDIACFAKQLPDQPISIDLNSDLDSVMILAIQVLRFHLLELEKVHELCLNFTTRYINCLKGKMPMDLVIDDRDSAVPTKTELDATKLEQSYFGQEAPSSGHPLSDVMQSNRMGNSTAHHQEQHNHHQSLSTHHSTDSSSPTGSALEGSTYSGEGGGEEDSDHGKKPQQKKRGIFPKQATNIMRAWLFQNLTHPYPSEEQKKSLANQTGLTILQVNNWFINARRRIVQPMIDQSNRAVSSAISSYSPDGPAGMGRYLMDGQPAHMAMRHPAWASGFQGITGADMMAGPSMAMTNGPFNSTSTISGAHPSLHHQLRAPPSQMLFPGSHHHQHAAAAAAAMMMPHHMAAASGHNHAHPHHLHPSQASMNPADMSSHMLGHTC